MTPEEYLHSKGLTPRNAPGEWLIRCVSCGDSSNPRHAHLYVNKDHGAWKCHRCQESGSFADLQRLFGDEPLKEAKLTAEAWQIFLRTVTICQDILLDYPDVIKYLRDERGLEPETIGKYRLGWMDRTYVPRMKEQGFGLNDLRDAGIMGVDANAPMFINRIIIPYYNRDNVVTLRGKSIGGNTMQVRGIDLGLFGVDNVRAKDGDVMICEGEIDTMLADQLGYAACGVPGADTFKETWVPWFESARRVFVVLDADQAGRDGAAKIIDLIGPRARNIVLPVPPAQKSTDFAEYFQRDGHMIEEFEALLDEHRGKRVYTIEDAIDEREEIRKLPGLSIGWKEFDHWVHPGFLPGQVAILMAKTGAGKTAWLTQVLHNLSYYYEYEGHQHVERGPGVPLLMCSLEQTKSEIVERLERIAHFYDPWVTPDHLRQMYRNVRMNDENKIPPGDIPAIVEEYTDELGFPPRILVVDYLGYWARTFPGDSRYQQVSEAIMELKAIAKALKVVVLVAHQVSRQGKRGERLELDDARDSGVVEETGDFVFGLWAPHARDRDDNKELSSLERSDVRLEILKSRHGGVGREIQMLWAPASLALPSRGGHGVPRLIEMEYKMLDSGLLYPEILAKHQGGVYG